MRSFFAIALALVSLLTTTQAWTLQGVCLLEDARCACCAQAQDCGCAGSSEKAPVQIPAPVDARHELPACLCTVLSVMEPALVRPLIMETPARMAGSSPAGHAPHVPVFILHCAALC